MFRPRDNMIKRELVGLKWEVQGWPEQIHENAFGCPLALLIDSSSQSSSELFAAPLKAIIRVVVKGERSPGRVTESDTSNDAAVEMKQWASTYEARLLE